MQSTKYIIMEDQFQQISERLKKIEQALSLKKQDVFITSDEFCELTGMSKNTFYQTRKNLPITAYYFGRKLRFKRVDVENWINNTVSTEPFAFVPAQH
ncbi:MAG: helix-turn-helix domain-containing protein [Proteobacteria bacterium]|nr:helix-turn-helix domain-containing protein [Pseudomonadota bacterium]